jgi:hypothetical protein
MKTRMRSETLQATMEDSCRAKLFRTFDSPVFRSKRIPRQFSTVFFLLSISLTATTVVLCGWFYPISF